MLRLQLNRDLERFEKAGMTEEAGKVKKRLAGLDKELAAAETPTEEPKAKTSSKAKEA